MSGREMARKKNERGGRLTQKDGKEWRSDVGVLIGDRAQVHRKVKKWVKR